MKKVFLFLPLAILSVSAYAIDSFNATKKSAELGDAGAQFDLGVCYAKGNGIEKNPEEAAKWFHKAAEQGNADAEFALCECYEKGIGVPQDCKEAVKWLRKAAEHDKAFAQLVLGSWYYNGKYVPQDCGEAIKWLRKAAKNGNSSASFLLALYYEKAGEENNKTKAYAWYVLASKNGESRANESIKRLDAELAPAQKEEALKLSEKYGRGEFE